MEDSFKQLWVTLETSICINVLSENLKQWARIYLYIIDHHHYKSSYWSKQTLPWNIRVGPTNIEGRALLCEADDHDPGIFHLIKRLLHLTHHPSVSLPPRETRIKQKQENNFWSSHCQGQRSTVQKSPKKWRNWDIFLTSFNPLPFPPFSRPKIYLQIHNKTLMLTLDSICNYCTHTQ